MHRSVKPDEWAPSGIESLDPIAWQVVRSDLHFAVMAGPGAGKTETLAQRACYLLQTGQCPSPRKILAVSYKRDSARILRERLRLRCPEDAWRFHSVTFDSFAKHLLDRFLGSLPERWRPTANYEVFFPKREEVEEFLGNLAVPDSFPSDALIGLRSETFLVTYFCANRFLPERSPATPEEHAAHQYLMLLLKQKISRLTFPMITRLAEAILISNPLILSSMRACYSHVFIDEFQDTSAAQYDLLLTAFQDSPSVVTAVGDCKQKIMTFAGAIDDSFSRIESDLGAKIVKPVVNYRSAPELIRILRVLASAVEVGGAEMVAPEGKAAGGHCAVHTYADQREEAMHIAELVESWVNDVQSAGDICVITKIKPDRYGAALAVELAKRGIRTRIETDANDFLGEDAAVDCLYALRIAVAGRSPQEYSEVANTLDALYCRADDDEEAGRNVRRRITAFCDDCRRTLKGPGAALDLSSAVVHQAISLYNRERYTVHRPQYTQADYLDTTLDKVSAHLAKVFDETGDWLIAIDEALGRNVVAITSIHKCKGREYSSVVFLGLEDGAFFSFDREPDENTRAFFVAFSRAKERILFTFTKQRNGSINAIRKTIPLYTLLENAGVEVLEY